MIAYFDTSSVVPLLVDEPSSEMCSRLWDDATRVVSARLLYAEAMAALSQAMRVGRLGNDELVEASAELERTVTQIDHVEITELLVRDAGALAQELGLRGYDAVHLAAASSIADQDTVFIAGDVELTGAAEALGLAVARTA